MTATIGRYVSSVQYFPVSVKPQFASIPDCSAAMGNAASYG